MVVTFSTARREIDGPCFSFPKVSAVSCVDKFGNPIHDNDSSQLFTRRNKDFDFLRYDEKTAFPTSFDEKT